MIDCACYPAEIVINNTCQQCGADACPVCGSHDAYWTGSGRTLRCPGCASAESEKAWERSGER